MPIARSPCLFSMGDLSHPRDRERTEDGMTTVREHVLMSFIELGMMFSSPMLGHGND